LKVLHEEGYIRGFEITENEKGKQLEIALKYYDGKPVIKEISRVSKPGMRVYSSVKTMPTYKNNMGISILSTSKGVMTNFSAQSANIGGEILCRVY
jgi:small subunit ribosomal protein S8